MTEFGTTKDYLRMSDIAEKAEAQNTRMRDALGFASAWLNRWAVHPGNCQGGHLCKCGLTAVRFDVAAALDECKEASDDT